MAQQYARFEVTRPDNLSDGHWACISIELDRLARAIDADDAGQAISDLKCLVEAISRIVLAVDGTPAGPADSFDATVNRAHDLLARQPGRALENTSPFSKIASQANKIVRNLAEIRNEYGGGHGRAHVPLRSDEMLVLALDYSLSWTRWALRRLGYFVLGRPSELIRDLIDQQISFYSGTLAQRLEAANLPALEPQHQRGIGVAVGQRTMQDTFVVRIDGMERCRDSDDLAAWPRDYRVGLANGLWFSRDDRLTMTPASVQNALMVLDPVDAAGAELTDLINRAMRARAVSRPREGLSGEWGPDTAVTFFVRNRIPLRPEAERDALQRLADAIDPGPF